MKDPSIDRNKALELAAYLVEECGIPIFCAPPRKPREIEAGMSEFDFPLGWQNFEPNTRWLSRWKPLWAVCAVMGVKCDVIDVDPRNGGLESYQAIKAAELLPPIFGEISTPSGGMHLYVGRSGLHKASPAKGIDLQAGGDDEPPFTKGRGFVYITPTVRKSKITGEWKLYTETTRLDLSGIEDAPSDPEFKPWGEFLASRLGKAEEHHKDPVWDRAEPHNDREQAYVKKMMAGVASEMAAAPVGQRNDTLNKKAFLLGRYCAGCGIPVAWAKGILRAAALSTGLTKSEVEYRLRRSVEQGLMAPLAVGPFKPEVKAQIAQDKLDSKAASEYADEYDEICEEFLSAHTGE